MNYTQHGLVLQLFHYSNVIWVTKTFCTHELDTLSVHTWCRESMTIDVHLSTNA